MKKREWFYLGCFGVGGLSIGLGVTAIRHASENNVFGVVGFILVALGCILGVITIGVMMVMTDIEKLLTQNQQILDHLGIKAPANAKTQ